MAKSKAPQTAAEKKAKAARKEQERQVRSGFPIENSTS